MLASLLLVSLQLWSGPVSWNVSPCLSPPSPLESSDSLSRSVPRPSSGVLRISSREWETPALSAWGESASPTSTMRQPPSLKRSSREDTSNRTIRHFLLPRRSQHPLNRVSNRSSRMTSLKCQSRKTNRNQFLVSFKKSEVSWEHHLKINLQFNTSLDSCIRNRFTFS